MRAVLGWCLVAVLAGVSGLSRADLLDDAVRFDIASDEIEAAEVSANVAWVKLVPSAARKLEAITEGSYGKTVEVRFDSVILLRTQVYAAIRSGVIQINDPPESIRSRLFRFGL